MFVMLELHHLSEMYPELTFLDVFRKPVARCPFFTFFRKKQKGKRTP